MKAVLILPLALLCVVNSPSRITPTRDATPLTHLLTNRASFDGRRLLLAGWDVPMATLWDVETGERIQEFIGHVEGVRAVALSADGRRALTGAGSTAHIKRSEDNSVRVWDVDSGKELRRFDGISYPAWESPA